MTSVPVQPLILAAGRASRMNGGKLGEAIAGKPMIAHVADAVAAAGLPSPIVVLGHDPDVVRRALADRPVRYVQAEDYAEGLSRSLRAGVLAVGEVAGAVLVLLGDMPFVSPALLRMMAQAAADDAIVVPRFGGRPGNPVLWGRKWFSRLASVQGDRGGKPLLAELATHVRYVEWQDDGIHRDIDTPDMLAAAQGDTR